MKPLLQVENLEIAFVRNKVKTIYTDKLNFTVNQGEIVGVVGESGCGKSITALSIMGLLSNNGSVESGKILFDDKDLLALSEKELDQIRGKELAMIFQNVMASLNPVFTIGNQLTETIKIHLGYDKKESKTYAISLLEKVGLSEPESIYRKFPHMLSGGMRQRVMIAMAIACHPKLIIADEPTTALDVTIQMQIMKLLMDLRKEYGMSIILITHDIGLIAELADRVMVMYAGQIVEESLVDTLFKEAMHPYTRALLKSIPRIDSDKEQKLYSIPGTVPENYQDIEGCRFADRCPYTVGRCLEKQEYRKIDSNHFIRCHMTSFKGKEVNNVTE